MARAMAARLAQDMSAPASEGGSGSVAALGSQPVAMRITINIGKTELELLRTSNEARPALLHAPAKRGPQQRAGRPASLAACAVRAVPWQLHCASAPGLPASETVSSQLAKCRMPCSGWS